MHKTIWPDYPPLPSLEMGTGKKSTSVFFRLSKDIQIMAGI